MRLLPASFQPIGVGLFVLMMLCGCHSHHTATSSGPAFFFTGPLTLSRAQPGATQSTTVTFTLSSYSYESFANVPYIAYLDNDIQELVASGVVPLIPANGASATVSFTAFANAPGAHSITVFVDPGNNLALSDTDDNLASIAVTYADFDLAFSGAPTVTPSSPTTADTISLTFNVANIDTSGNGTTATNISYQVLESTGFPTSGVFPVNGQATNLLVSGVIPSIAANATVAISAVIPGPVSAGEHEYTIVINSVDPVPEQDTTNDSASIDVMVAVSN